MTLLAIGFAAGFVVSDYELRRLNREGARLQTVWSLAPAGILVDGVQVEEPDENHVGTAIVTGDYDIVDAVPEYATRLLDSGLLGTKLMFVKLNPNRQFVIAISGEKSNPPSTERTQRD